MNRDHLVEALSAIRPSFIEQAADYVPPVRKTTSRRWLAASLILVTLCTAVMLPFILQRDDTHGLPSVDDPTDKVVYWGGELSPFGPSETTKTENALFVAEKWEWSILDAPYNSYQSGIVLDGAAEGDPLATVRVRSVLHDYVTDTDVIEETLRAEVYAIRGVSPTVAVVVRYLDQGEALTTTHDYVCYAPNYPVTSLDAFFADFNAAAYLSIPESTVTVYSATASGTVRQRYKDFSAEQLADLQQQLVSLSGTTTPLPADCDYEKLLDDCETVAILPIRFPTAGSGLVDKIYVLDSGHLLLTYGGTTYRCGVDTDSAAALITAIREQGTPVENTDSTTVTGIATQTSRGKTE